MSTEVGLRNVAFEVDDLQAAIDWVAANGYSHQAECGFAARVAW